MCIFRGETAFDDEWGLRRGVGWGAALFRGRSTLEPALATPKFLWVHCPGHAAVKGNDRADRLMDKATITSGLRLGRSEALRSLRHYLRAQNQGHRTTDCLEEKGVERGSTRRSSLKGRERGWPFLVSQVSVRHRFKGNVGETFERRDGSHMGFSQPIDTILK